MAICGPHCADGYDLEVLAMLVPEPSNRYDRHAVRVEIDGRLVGYLSRDDAQDWRPTIDRVVRHHGYAAAQANVRGGFIRGRERGNYGVWLRISDLSIERTPDGETRLPPGLSVSVSNEEHYQEALALAAVQASSRGGVLHVRAELRWNETGNPWKKADAGGVVEVLVDGRTVGFLTPKMTERYGPTVRDDSIARRRVTCAAVLTPGKRAGRDVVEITLDAMSPELL